MSGDLAGYLKNSHRRSRLPKLLAAIRFSIAICLKPSSSRTDPTANLHARVVNPCDRPLEQVISPKTIDALEAAERQVNSPDRVGARRGIWPNLLRCTVEPQFTEQLPRQRGFGRLSRLSNGRGLTSCASTALLVGALIIVGLAIFTALKLADRLVRPVGQLARPPAGSEGDFSTRVTVAKTEDDQTLARPSIA
jgi:two-component system nitrogen regulation sensor histidine kinase NtrY